MAAVTGDRVLGHRVTWLASRQIPQRCRGGGPRRGRRSGRGRYRGRGVVVLADDDDNDEDDGGDDGDDEQHNVADA